MSVFKYLAGALALSTFTLAFDIDFAAIEAAGPPPSPSIATNVPAQTVTYDAVAVEASAAAVQSAAAQDPSKVKRAACDAQVLGSGPVPSPDTDSAFVSYSAFSSAASAAPTPLGYINTFKNLQAENNALGYMGYTLLSSYDVPGCAAKCDAINGCAAFNVAFERSPSQDPSPSGGACDQPKTTTLIKCVFWGGPVTSSNAVNNGQWRNSYHVVVAGSNGYVNQTVDYCAGYTGPSYYGNQAINAPNDCNNLSSLVGSQYWNDGKPFDTRRCSAACSAQTASNPNSPCYFFNTYVISKNGQSYGQYCAMYNKQIADSYATLNAVTYNGASYSVSYSYSFANSNNNGLPCVANPITGCGSKKAGQCGTYQQCNAGLNCYCGSDTSGKTVCFQDSYCAPAQTCSTNAQCGSGNVCLNSNSCCGFSICVPNSVCANGLSSRHIFRKRQDSDELSAVHVPGDDSTSPPSDSGDDDTSSAAPAATTNAAPASTASSDAPASTA